MGGMTQQEIDELQKRVTSVDPSELKKLQRVEVIKKIYSMYRDVHGIPYDIPITNKLILFDMIREIYKYRRRLHPYKLNSLLKVVDALNNKHNLNIY